LVILIMAVAGILVGISYLMLDILSSMVITPKTPVRERAARGEMVVPLEGKEAISLQVSADGSMLALVERGVENGKAVLKIVEMGGGNSVILTLDITGAWAGWLGESGSLVYEDGGDIYRLDVEEGAQLNLTSSGEYDEHPLPSPDGGYILWSRSPAQAGSGDTEFWTMRSDGSEQQLLAPASDFPTWGPSGAEVLSRRITSVPSDSQSSRFSLQKSRPGRGSWEFYTDGQGRVMYIWWPGKEDIYYVSQLFIESRDKIKGVVFKVDSEDPFEQKRVASMEGLGSDDQYYRFYPSRTGERLAYVSEMGLEVLDMEDKTIHRLTGLDAAPPLAWNEAGDELFYSGEGGIYKVSLEEDQG